MHPHLMAYNVHWIAEAQHPEHGWVGIGDSHVLRHIYNASSRCPEDANLLWQFVRDIGMQVFDPQGHLRCHNGWPSVRSEWARSTHDAPWRLPPHTIPDPSHSAVGKGAFGRWAQWPNLRATQRFLARLQHTTHCLGAPSVLTTATDLLANHAHAKLRSARLAATLGPITPANTRLLITWG